jgi:phytoene dehydrogenase-like protein
VRLRGGEEVGCDAAVLSVSAGVAARLLPDGALPARLMTRLRGWRYGLGTFKADWALSGPVPWAAEVAREAGVVHLGDTLSDLFAAHHEAGAGRVPDAPAMVLGQHTIHDPTRAPEGRHTLYGYAHVPHRLDVPADEVVARMERRIEAFAPGFGALVLGRAVRSPADLERENPSMVGGDLAGGSCEIDQQAIFRPAPELVRGRTPLPGLYLAGPSVHPGAGVHGVSGTAAARAVLADRRLPRRALQAVPSTTRMSVSDAPWRSSRSGA